MATRAGAEGAERPALEEEKERALPRALPQPAAAALVFVAAGAVLMLEILAVRLLAPYVGLTLETTTSIIGAALAGIALGAAVGGYFADRVDTRLLIVGLLLGGGGLALLTVPAVHWLGPGARGEGTVAALGITAVALVPAAAALSAVSPAVAHLQLHDLRASGTIVGRLSAWGTAGALVGTFGTGFVIVPALPVGTAVLLIGAALLAVGIVLGVTTALLSPARALAAGVVAVALAALTATSGSPCLKESEYHCLSLKVDPAYADGYALVLDDSIHSYTDLRDPTDLKYPYTRWIAGAIDSENPGGNPLDAVVVGGGAFTLPRWLLATRPGSTADVLEVDPGIVELDEERLGLRTSADLRAIVGDARISMLDIPSDSADVVVGDAFSGHSVPWHLTTAEWLDEVRRVLKPDGIYAMNVIDLQPLEFLEAETATFLESFDDVQLVTVEEGSGNTILFGSDRQMPRLVSPKAARREGRFAYSRAELVPFAAASEPLRDDFAPVDQLRTFE